MRPKTDNEQISHETSANAYIDIGSWCERIGQNGSAKFFLEQAAEGKDHLLKIIHYLNNAGYESIIPAIEKPSGSFESLEAAFKFGLESEQKSQKKSMNLWILIEKKRLFDLFLFAMVCHRANKERNFVSDYFAEI